MNTDLLRPQSVQRVVIIAEEGYMFSGEFLAEIVCNLAPRLVMIAAVKPQDKANNQQHILRMWKAIGLMPLVKLITKNLVARSRYKSLADLAAQYRIPFYNLEQLNSVQTKIWLSNLNPDLVISSVTEILKSSLLSIPKIGFLNKHAGLLPAYAGLMPMVHALSKGEKKVGMTVHMMTSEIDNGPILSQRAYSINSKDTVLSAYHRVYAGLPNQINEAISVIEGNQKPKLVQPRPKPSYYSTPTFTDWINLKHNGRRLA